MGYVDVSVSKRLIITISSSFVSTGWRIDEGKGGGIDLILG